MWNSGLVIKSTYTLPPNIGIFGIQVPIKIPIRLDIEIRKTVFTAYILPTLDSFKNRKENMFASISNIFLIPLYMI